MKPIIKKNKTTEKKKKKKLLFDIYKPSLTELSENDEEKHAQSINYHTKDVYYQARASS